MPKAEKIVTPRFRVSFERVWKPQIDEASGKKQYSVVMLFDKDADLSKLKSLIKSARDKKWGDDVPKNLILPLKDGNEKRYEGYKDKIYVNAKSIDPVGVVDDQKQVILDQEEFYSGCYARASVTAYAWGGDKRHKGKNGVSIGLQNLQKLEDGEAFSGRTKAEDDFEAIAVSDEDGTQEADTDELLSI